MAREMKDSGIEWIGEIPVHWNLVPFYRLVDQVSDSIVDGPFGSDMKNEEYVDAGVPVIQLGAIKENGMDFSKMHFISDSKADILRRHNAFPFNLAIAKMMPAGRCCEIPDKFERYVVSADVIRSSVSNAVLRHFLNYAFNTYIKVWANAETSGSTRARINIEKLKKFKFALPDQNEMEFILNKLDRECAEIDKAVEATKASIEEYKKLRQAIITEAVTKGLDPNVEMKDSGIEWIGEIPEDSKIIRLKKIVAIPVTDGTHNTPEYASEENGSPFLSSKDVTKGYIDWANIKYITRDLHEILYKETRPQKNDILLAKNGTTGIAALNDTDKVFDIYVTLALIRPNTSIVLPKYLQYCINSDISKRQFNEHLIGIGVPNLHLNVIENTKVILHNKQSQQHIIEYLDTKCAEIDSLIKSKEKLIEELTAYRKSLIFEYVTGKKEVPAV